MLDLAEGGAADEAIALAAVACQRGLTWDEALLATPARRRGHRWGTLLTEALVDIGAGAQSTFEVRYVRDVERAHGLPPGRPRSPRVAAGGHHHYGHTEQRVLVELDGMAFHSSPQARLSDGRRDRATVSEGWATPRAFWPDVAVTPCALALDIGALLVTRGWDGPPRACLRRGCVIETGPGET